jgi:hypothetical protein
MLPPVLLVRLAQALVLALGVSLAGCAGTSQTAPAPARTLGAADYYPLQPGWKWAYDLEKDGEHILAIYAVLERTPEVAIVRFGDESMAYGLTRDGIAQREGVVNGDYVLKNPIAVGAAWRVAGGDARIAAVGQAVTVPAGTYADCIVVETLRSEPARLTRTTFAPGVGPVALEVQVQLQGRFITTMRATLRGLTRPGEEL